MKLILGANENQLVPEVLYENCCPDRLSILHNRRGTAVC